MDINVRDILTITALTGVAVLGYKLKKLSEKYENAIDDIADGLDVNVDNEIINAAVEKAVNKETALQVNTACSKAVSAVRDDISMSVKRAVEVEKMSLKENTKKEIEKRIASIDITQAKKEVIEEAQQIVAERLEEDTKAIAGTYEASIKKMADMCETMIQQATVSAQKAREPVDFGDVKTIVKLIKEV